MMKRLAGVMLAALLAASTTLSGQENDAKRWAALFANHYSFHSEIAYGLANNIPLKLDVWERHDAEVPAPTVVYIHGGGWVFGGKGGADVPLHAAAIVNWYGITDVADLLSGPNRKTYAVAWLGGEPNGVDLATRLSPLSYIRKDLPPIITIHGDHDPTVPYSHAIRLREALDKVAVPNQLVTIPGGVHGGFNDEQTLNAYDQIWKFPSAHVNGLK